MATWVNGTLVIRRFNFSKRVSIYSWGNCSTARQNSKQWATAWSPVTNFLLWWQGRHRGPKGTRIPWARARRRGAVTVRKSSGRWWRPPGSNRFIVRGPSCGRKRYSFNKDTIHCLPAQVQSRSLQSPPTWTTFAPKFPAAPLLARPKQTRGMQLVFCCFFSPLHLLVLRVDVECVHCFVGIQMDERFTLSVHWLLTIE